MATTTQVYLAAAALGVASHLGIFIRGEWHMKGPDLMKVYSVLSLVIVLVQTQLTVSFSTFLAACSYAAGLFTSIIIYRRFFHRLRHFDGPWVAGITKFWHMWKTRKGNNYEVLETLRHQYGPYIRTGPEELTVVDANIVPAIDGPGNKCVKAVYYDLFLPQKSVLGTREIREHDLRKRIWDRGFSKKAVANYEKRVVEYTELLASRIERLAVAGQRVDVSKWFPWWSFDVMGEFAFSKSFEMLKKEQWHFASELMRKFMSILGLLGPVPWLKPVAIMILGNTPFGKNWNSMRQWSRDQMRERIEKQEQVGQDDVSHWLIDASIKNESLEADRLWLNGDANLIIIAGSDTVSAALIFAFYNLARHPKYQQQLAEELKDVDIYDRAQLEGCEFLTAMINENLRLNHPVPTGGYRQTPPGGMTVSGRYIPGNVTIVAPRYSIARLESSYEKADQFVPERWTTRPDMVKDRTGYAPFLMGRYNCAGKHLAMFEMRFVIASLVKRFEVSFWDGSSERELFAHLKEHLTFSPGKLELRFTTRAKADDPVYGVGV